MHPLFLFGLHFCIFHLTRQKLMASLWLEQRQEKDHSIVTFTLTYSWFPSMFLPVPSPHVVMEENSKVLGGTMESLEFRL